MISRRDFLKVGIAGILALSVALFCKRKVRANNNGEFPAVFPFSFPVKGRKFIYLPIVGK